MKFPTEGEWNAAISAGFRSNGATMSPDTIYFVRIANASNKYPPLPADLHDYRYWSGGDQADKFDADREFFAGLLDVINEKVWWPFRMLARRRALTYYEAVHLLGGRFFRYHSAQRKKKP